MMRHGLPGLISSTLWLLAAWWWRSPARWSSKSVTETLPHVENVRQTIATSAFVLTRA